MSVILWSMAHTFSSCGLALLPVILLVGLYFGYSLRRRSPAFSATIRRSFWIMTLFGVTVTAPLPLAGSLVMVDILLLVVGISFYSHSFSPAIRRYGRIQTWASLICLADFAMLWQAGLLDHPQTLDCTIAETALIGVCFQLLLVGLGIWASVMVPLITEMRRR